MKIQISIFLLVIFLISCGSSASSDSKNSNASKASSSKSIQNTEGEQLFRVKCSACHAINKKLIGPPLASSMENWENNKEELYTYVRNPQEAMEKGYKRALEIEDYDPSMMNPNPNLTDEQLDQIFAYIEEKSESN